MENEIFYKILGQAVRFALRAVAGYLAYIGIGKDDQTTFVEVSAGVIAPIILVAIAEGWSWFQKRFQQGMTETALLSPSSTPMSEIKLETAKTVTGTSY